MLCQGEEPSQQQLCLDSNDKRQRSGAPERVSVGICPASGTSMGNVGSVWVLFSTWSSRASCL